MPSLLAITEKWKLFHPLCVCVIVCVWDGGRVHSTMNITCIDQANVRRKGCRPQLLINIPLITWLWMLLAGGILVAPHPPNHCQMYINGVPPKEISLKECHFISMWRAALSEWNSFILCDLTKRIKWLCVWLKVTSDFTL